MEGQRADVQHAQAKKAVLGKLDRTRADQEARAQALGRDADLEEDQASLHPLLPLPHACMRACRHSASPSTARPPCPAEKLRSSAESLFR